MAAAKFLYQFAWVWCIFAPLERNSGNKHQQNIFVSTQFDNYSPFNFCGFFFMITSHNTGQGFGVAFLNCNKINRYPLMTQWYKDNVYQNLLTSQCGSCTNISSEYVLLIWKKTKREVDGSWVMTEKSFTQWVPRVLYWLRLKGSPPEQVQQFSVLFVVNVNKLLNKENSSRWFETS